MTVPLNPSADGLNIDPDFGVISGTPAEDAIQSGPYAVTITMDDGDGGSTTQTFDWTVNDSTVSIQGDAIGQQAGAGVDTFPVAAFTDPDLNRQASDYAATIAWGDGQTSQGEVDGGNGAYTVSGDHVYLHPGDWPIQITVTDPAGGTATAATTASVTPAPLTATGNLQDGATSGLMSTFTVATFSDANGYLAAGDFTATINWGDGTATTTGVIDGADGAFRVTGNHTYAYDGTYTVSVTVTDADGATATTTSQITAGDIQAGLDNTLTVASFTSADPNATAASFTALIQWGDGGIMMGGTAGTVVQEGNQFVVLGAHAFQAAGVYTVQVTVTDLSGDQLTSSETVQAAPAPATGFGGDLAAQDGYVSDAALALFTLPQGYGALGQYTATADWGDGTSSSASLANNGGIWEALGDHGYSGPGQYAVRTLLYNAALQVVAAAVTLVEADTPAKIIGPAVVPGNSIYRYEVAVTPPTAADKIKKDFPSTTEGFSVGAGASRVRSGYHQNARGEYDYFWADIQFDNKPAVVDITLAKWLQDETGIAATLPVTVVQVTVTNPKNTPAFVKNDQGVTQQKNVSSREWSIDGKTANPYTKTVSSGNVAFTNGAVTEIKVPAISWLANVILTGPGGKGADHIHVGSVQTVSVQEDYVVFTKINQKLVISSLSLSDGIPTEMLDKHADQAGPWYNAGHILPGKSGLVSDNDTPTTSFPLSYGKDVQSTGQATVIVDREAFSLHIGATTIDGGEDAQNSVFSEANASWSVSFDGTVSLPKQGVNWTPTDESKVVMLPDPNGWTIPTSVDPVDTNLTIANLSDIQQSWTTEQFE